MKSNSVTRREMIFTGGAAVVATVLAQPRIASAEPDGISRTAESIRQEVTFKSHPMQVYQALTETKRFDRVVQLSGVMQSAALAQMKRPTEISAQPGGAFAAFGGYITGRQVELVPSELIVQAWRSASWDRAIYSIAKFAITPQGTGTRLLFDHTGFPVGEADHLALGWNEHYWDPLHKYLAETGS